MNAIKHARPLATVVLGAVLALLGACASNDPNRSGLLEPYRTDLPQGNYLTREMLQQISPGQSRAQVRAVLGAPLLNPVFRDNRWDYVFRLKHPSGRVDQRQVSVLFDGDKVLRLEAGDNLPERESAEDPALPGFRPRPPGQEIPR